MGLRKPLNIFVHRASGFLTDHESHGDGLICFSLLNGLAERGHQIYAFTDRTSIQNGSPNLHVRAHKAQTPVHSLSSWEMSKKADEWFAELSRNTQFDLVWRMHPYNKGCPQVPRHDSLPLVIGPIPYDWPEGSVPESQRPKSRFGFSLASILLPIAMGGWQKTLAETKLLFCMTAPHAARLQAKNPNLTASSLPVIVEPPTVSQRPERWSISGRPIQLAFVANLLPHKRPEIFCEAVELLRERGHNVEGVLLGDGPERAKLDAWAKEHKLEQQLHFRGKVPHEAVWEQLAQSDFLISTSQGEPYGRSIVEAMAMGIPCVCHASGGPADLISNGHSGLLVQELSAAAYTDALLPILEAPAKWDHLSNNAQTAASFWRKESVLDNLEAALYSVVPAKENA